MDKIQELKAKAYDMIAAIERGQLMLRQINDEIAAEIKKQAEESKKEG